MLQCTHYKYAVVCYYVLNTHTCTPCVRCTVRTHWQYLPCHVCRRVPLYYVLMRELFVLLHVNLCPKSVPYLKLTKHPRGGQRRPLLGVLLKCELSMGALAGNNQAQNPEVAADST